METILLLANKRGEGLSAKELRIDRKIPAVLYGHGRDNVTLQLDYQTFRRVYNKAGQSTIIDLDLDGKLEKVMVHDIQYHPLTDEITHIDFVYVRMNEEITASIPLEFIGTALAVKDLGGILDAKRNEIEVKCLPKDLVTSIEVDISALVDFNSSIHLKDLNIPSGINVVLDPEETIVTVLPPRVEEVNVVESTGDEAVGGDSDDKKEEAPSETEK